MRLERKTEIRSLIKTIPLLVKAGLVSQAFETEKIIASTFNFSDEFLATLGGIPQNHIETIQEIYSDVMSKSYDTGYKTAEVKIKSTSIDMKLPPEEFDRELEIRMPMAFGTAQAFLDVFREQINKYFEATPDTLMTVMEQFEKDLLLSYKDGIKDYLNTNPVTHEEKKDAETVVEEPKEAPALQIEKEVSVSLDTATEMRAKLAASVFSEHAPREIKKLFKLQAEGGHNKANARMLIEFAEWMVRGRKADDYIPDETYKTVATNIDKSLLKKLEDYAKLLGSGDAEKVLRYTLGLPLKGKTAKAAVDAEDKEDKVSDLDSSTYSKLEAYTKLLKNSEAEMVLRYTLGLPPKKVSASYKVQARQIGPYDTQALTAKIESLLASHEVDPDSKFQVVVVDCLVAGMGEMDDVAAAKAIAQKLQLAEDEATSLESAESRADEIATQLNVATGLPGYFMFLVLPDDDFCLTYNYEHTDDSEEVEETEEVEDEIVDEETEEKSTVASLPKGPQGVLSKSEQTQIENLLQLGKSRTYKDIKRASPKLAVHLGKIMNNIKTSKVSMLEGLSQLKAKMEDMVQDCFGHDGSSYYNHLKNK
jgi:hypothetical protein